MRTSVPHRLLPTLVLAGALVAALALRWTLLDVRSGDYRTFLDPWYTHLAENGFAGLGDTFSNYNTPYLVLLALATHLPIPEIAAIKGISVVFDLVLAFFAYRIVAVLRPGSTWWPTLVTVAVLFLPTVVMNSAAWAQCDAIYASLCLGSLYFLITRRPWPAALLFGLAFAFKLQAIFFLPVLVLVLLVNRLPLRSLLAAPAAFLAALVPALVAGRSLLSQLAVYPAQVTGSSGAGVAVGGIGRSLARGGAGPGGGFGGGPRGGAGTGDGGLGGVGTGHAVTSNAPAPYAWLPADVSEAWKWVGLTSAATVGLVLAIWRLRRRRRGCADGPTRRPWPHRCPAAGATEPCRRSPPACRPAGPGPSSPAASCRRCRCSAPRGSRRSRRSAPAVT